MKSPAFYPRFAEVRRRLDAVNASLQEERRRLSARAEEFNGLQQARSR